MSIYQGSRNDYPRRTKEDVKTVIDNSLAASFTQGKEEL